MNTQLPDKEKFTAAMAALDAGTGNREVGRRLKVSEATVRHWRLRREHFTAALSATVPASASAAPAEPEVVVLRREVTELRKAIKAYSKEDATAEYIKKKVFGIVEDAAEWKPPKWTIEPGRSLSAPGVPTLLASDWHVGEMVFPAQVNGVNEYNLAIMRERSRALIDRTIDLLKHHMVNPVYPGIVFALGGDMLSGDIHEELVATNEIEIMPCVMETVSVLMWCIRTLADAFGSVFLPCVTGNHGRNTHKIRAKGRAYTNFDWLIYRILELKLRDDKRVTFLIPDGSDALYRIFNHRYLLTHGDQFRGGDGVIGALGPIIRGDHRKRSRNGQIGMEYDTMLCGHWHQLIALQRLIVNGSLIGYNEYAYTNNFPFERPRQGLWLTHPKRGITFSLPVNVDSQPGPDASTGWVSVPKAA